MLTLNFNEIEYFDEVLDEFVSFEAKVVNFEYSLSAVAKWESIYKVPFLSSSLEGLDPKVIDFYLCMTDDTTLSREYITPEVALMLKQYVDDVPTATTFTGQNGNKSSGKTYTSEEIYALMFMNHIPLEYENRNLHRLLVVLRVISVYSNPPKKMSKHEVMQENARLNAERKAKYNTRG